MINGILCIDKPEGFTSFDVVAKMRGIAGQKKIGHGGTLDPMATGVLPLFLGSATRACDMVCDDQKEYLATFCLGYTTDTLDRTGTVLSRSPVTVGPARVKEALAAFRGHIRQVPPMYSAVKVDGHRLYDLARQGVEVARKSRPVTIHELELTGQGPEPNSYHLRVFCSKGTYIRTLIDDLGRALGCGATMTALQRTRSAGFTLKDCITLTQAEAQKQQLCQLALPVERVFLPYPACTLSAFHARLFCNGVRLRADQLTDPVPGPMRIYGPQGFLGVAQLQEGQLKVLRLFLGGAPC